VRIVLTGLAIVTLSGVLYGQTPADKKSTPAASTEGTTASPAPDGYSYRPDGRRDPFLSLISTGTDPHVVGKRTEGPLGFNVGEISVRGILQSRSALVAMIQGPDNKTYVIHQGDKFADGVVKSVTPQGLVVMQDITDPLSTQKQREVRKLLRSLEDAKEKL
jgi:Tfp pilus assembly protein PilP